QVFDALGEIVGTGPREVQALEAANLLPGAAFANELMPMCPQASLRDRKRREWFTRTTDILADADFVFVDPDNGLQPAGFSTSSAKAGKSVMLREILELARPARCLIVYHHHTRRAGGHSVEIASWADRLREVGFDRVDALRARPYSPRVYF